MEEAFELDARELNSADALAMAELYQGNPQYFEHTGEEPSEELALRDLADIPDGVDRRKKRVYGFFRGGRLVAIIDLLFGYPDDACAYIGLFMVAHGEQGRGVGSRSWRLSSGDSSRMGFAAFALPTSRATSRAVGFGCIADSRRPARWERSTGAAWWWRKRS